jgi:hypothetical protein
MHVLPESGLEAVAVGIGTDVGITVPSHLSSLLGFESLGNCQLHRGRVAIGIRAPNNPQGVRIPEAYVHRYRYWVGLANGNGWKVGTGRTWSWLGHDGPTSWYAELAAYIHSTVISLSINRVERTKKLSPIVMLWIIAEVAGMPPLPALPIPIEIRRFLTTSFLENG